MFIHLSQSRFQNSRLTASWKQTEAAGGAVPGCAVAGFRRPSVGTRRLRPVAVALIQAPLPVAHKVVFPAVNPGAKDLGHFIKRRTVGHKEGGALACRQRAQLVAHPENLGRPQRYGFQGVGMRQPKTRDRKSTRLNSSHVAISYA